MVLTTLPSFHFIVTFSPSFPVFLRTQSFISQRDRAFFFTFRPLPWSWIFLPFRVSPVDRIHILPIFFHVHRIFFSSESSCAILPYDGPNSAIKHMLTILARMLASHGQFSSRDLENAHATGQLWLRRSCSWNANSPPKKRRAYCRRRIIEWNSFRLTRVCCYLQFGVVSPVFVVSRYYFRELFVCTSKE